MKRRTCRDDHGSIIRFAAVLIALAMIAIPALAAQGPLGDAIGRLVSSHADGWIAWSVPIADPSIEICCSTGDDSTVPCRLGGSNWGLSTRDSSERSSTSLRVYARFEKGELERIRLFSDSCMIDATGEKVEDVGEVDSAESIALLQGWLSRNGRIAERSLAAIALHAGPAAELAVERVAGSSSYDGHLRRSAVFWLGRTGGERGFDYVKKVAWSDADDKMLDSAVFAISISPVSRSTSELAGLARRHPRGAVRGKAVFWIAQKKGDEALEVIRDCALHDPDVQVRKQAVFAASQVDDDRAVQLLVGLAKGAESSEVRKSAIFWLGQKAGKKAAASLRELTNDPNEEIREKAVFAISQRPNDESIPLLADLARNNPSPGVRKKALFWLGQKDDPRVVKVFEEILEK